MATSQHVASDVHGIPRMNTFTKLIDLVLVGALGALLTGCPGDKDGSDSDPGPASGIGETSGTPAAGGETGPEAATAPEGPQAIPMLCSVDGGKWCKGCPQGDAGPLCCAGETCVPWDAASGVACAGSVGWCSNYSTADKQATCHDVK